MGETQSADRTPPLPTYPLERIRADFPALGTGFAFFDGPGGTQTPVQVGEAIAATLTGPLSNRGSGSPSQRNADDAVRGFRQAMADLLDADPRGVVYGRSATQLTYEFARALAKDWGPDDEVIVSRLDHDANVRPWVQAAEPRGARVRWADFDVDSAELTVEHVRPLLSEHTRLVAVTAASNLLGTVPPVAEIAALAHQAGALVYVDGVHAAAHAALSLHSLGADFLVCSPYKFLGPHCGVLAASPDLLESLRPDKLLPSTDAVPERFEHGTLPYETLAGVSAAVDYWAEIGASTSGSRRVRLEAAFRATASHEDRLRTRIEVAVQAMDGVKRWSRAARRAPTLLLTFDHRPVADAYQHLLERQVLAPAGNFYAIEASRHLGLGEEGGLRIGVAPYTDDEDVSRLLAGLETFLALR